MFDFVTDIVIAIFAFIVIFSFSYVLLAAFFEWLFEKDEEKTYQRTYVQVRKPPIKSAEHKESITKQAPKNTIKTVITETVYLD